MSYKASCMFKRLYIQPQEYIFNNKIPCSVGRLLEDILTLHHAEKIAFLRF